MITHPFPYLLEPESCKRQIMVIGWQQPCPYVPSSIGTRSWPLMMLVGPHGLHECTADVVKRPLWLWVEEVLLEESSSVTNP